MSWFGPKYSGSIALGAQNPSTAADWYEINLGLTRDSEGLDDNEEGVTVRGFWGGCVIWLAHVLTGRKFVGERPVLFTNDLEKSYEKLQSKQVKVTPIQADSAGNRFFRFYDLDENLVEVCSEALK
ncbi:MAG: VOC family protein [Candidatus Acidiferrum sp.]|jgi:hypothetical protein